MARPLQGAWAAAIGWTLLWALLISAPIVESDAYRYATVLLIILFFGLRRGDHPVPLGDPFSILCLVWGSYALARFAFGVFVLGEKGTSEWLYAFPLFFPALGAALYCSRRYIVPALTIFVVAACVALVISTDFVTALSGERIYPLYHHNPIHAAIGCGFIMIISGYWLWHLWEADLLTGWQRLAAPALAAVNMGLALFDIYGAKSKGVWLALVFAFLAVSGLLLLHRQSRRVLIALAVVVLFLGAGLYAVRDNVVEIAGPTFTAAFSLSEDAADKEPVMGAMRRAIAAPETPAAMRERLELWYNGLEIFQQYPLFGAGNDWLRLWKGTTYGDIQYNLLHNGYLEIMVRHGLFGILMLVVALVMSFRRVVAARRCGAISHAAEMGLMVATLFFLVTLATNSNNRLAIGESFFMVAGAAVIAASIATRRRALA